MAAQYHSLFTTQGLALLREAIQTGAKLGITHMAYGDGNGIVPTPNADFTKLVKEVYRTPLNRLTPSKDNQNWLEADGVIPSAVGGFNIREVGLYAGNILVAYANYPATFKPSADQGTAQIKTIRIVLQIDNTANFELKIDASVVMATIQAVEDAKQEIYKNTTVTLESIYDLENIEAWDRRTVSVRSRLPPNFGLKKPYVGGGEFQFIENSNAIANDGTVFNSNINIKGKWHRVYSEDVRASWFCGFGGIANDVTVNMQKAIDFTNSTDNASALCIDDKFLITSTLYIDRKTDTTKGDYVIFADGSNNGFLINKPMTMFSSRLDYLPADAPSYTKAACSEFTTFRKIDFESTIQHEDALVFDDKFLRLTFDGCTHRKIQAIKDAEYLQSVRWFNCKHRQNIGFFASVIDAYDCRVSFAQFENSAAGFNFRGIARGCHFDDNLYQGSTSPFIRAVGFFGGSIDRNYFEQNLDAELLIGVLEGISSGYSISSNIFMLREDLATDSSFYPVQVGLSRGFILSGNTSTGNMANTDRASLFEIYENGNAVPYGKKVMSSNANTPVNLIPAQSENQSSATLIRHKLNIISSSPETNAAIKLPMLSSFINGTTITIVNETGHGLYIYPNINERILGVGYNSPHLIGASSKIELAKSDSDYWTIV